MCLQLFLLVPDVGQLRLEGASTPLAVVFVIGGRLGKGTR